MLNSIKYEWESQLNYSKLWIIKFDDNNDLVKKKSEHFNNCEHLNNFLLANVKKGNSCSDILFVFRYCAKCQLCLSYRVLNNHKARSITHT